MRFLLSLQMSCRLLSMSSHHSFQVHLQLCLILDFDAFLSQTSNWKTWSGSRQSWNVFIILAVTCCFRIKVVWFAGPLSRFFLHRTFLSLLIRHVFWKALFQTLSLFLKFWWLHFQFWISLASTWNLATQFLSIDGPSISVFSTLDSQVEAPWPWSSRGLCLSSILWLVCSY